jgi:hypothetical protein
MGRIVVSVIAAACVFAGFRNLPPIEQPASSAAGLLLGGVVVVAFLLGRRSVRAEAVATAIASARADAAAAAHAGAQSVAQVVVQVGESGRDVAAREYGQPEWIAGPQRFDAEQLAGSDAVESIRDELLDVDHQRETS